VKYFRSFNFFSSLSFQLQGVHIVRKACIDRGEVTSRKLKRDNIEPSSVDVQGVCTRKIHRLKEEPQGC
jgi:hypothetical protein